MKNTLFILALFSVLLYSCGKDKKLDLPSDEEILTQKIKDIIPEQYLDTLKKYGMEIYQDVKPPNVEGTYSIKPFILEKSNISSDVPGYQFLNGEVKLFNQSTKDFGISLTGKNFLNTADTSLVTAISGAGNNFTIYGKVKSASGTNSAIFAVVISGSKEGTGIKNVKVGIINIDNSNGGGIFIKQGQGRVAYDSDHISESIAGSNPAAFSPKSSSSGGSMGQLTLK